ncbi:hypothetical protein HK097_009073 [Rhizophlyctis rosea]|uniref:SGNH hydrolase-type esterase domain-containing protein n=1 Tax=Rhizophlyctis rosea TaxID=64517 RepID=A0AAD5S9F4_9FUNG|nr:hypothetical protein HK097_009073 [Rhizophlyctis rosea]
MVCGELRSSWVNINRLSSTTRAKTHFDKVFAEPRHAQADIVILLVGFNDGRQRRYPEITPEQTVQNISSTARVLRNMGKEVWIFPIATHGDEDYLHPDYGDRFYEANVRRNELLLDWLSNTKDPEIRTGPLIYAFNFEYRHPSLWYHDGEHFSSKGYKKVAKDLFDELAPSLVKREFAKFSKQLFK